jgi:DNA-directed RNA polymerase specialized sigma24 family protein
VQNSACAPRFDELALAARDDVTGRARLVEARRRWARKYQGRGVDTDDLLQDAVRTIGRRLGVSGERVRSIEERALARIRAALNLGVDTGPRLLTQRREPAIRKEDRDEHPVPT